MDMDTTLAYAIVLVNKCKMITNIPDTHVCCLRHNFVIELSTVDLICHDTDAKQRGMLKKHTLSWCCNKAGHDLVSLSVFVLPKRLDWIPESLDLTKGD